MKTFNYQIYGKPAETFRLEIPDEIKNEDYYEIMQKMDFQVKRIGSPYHYVENSSPYMEIVAFYKKDVGCARVCVLELWDYNGAILEFYCEDEHAELAVLEKYSQIMANMISVEYRNVKMRKEEEDD